MHDDCLPATRVLQLASSQPWTDMNRHAQQQAAAGLLLFIYKPCFRNNLRQPVPVAAQLSPGTRWARGFESISRPGHPFALLCVIPCYNGTGLPMDRSPIKWVQNSLSTITNLNRLQCQSLIVGAEQEQTENEHFRGRCTGSSKTLPCNIDPRTSPSSFYLSDYV
jgi:hypothetical protein